MKFNNGRWLTTMRPGRLCASTASTLKIDCPRPWHECSVTASHPWMIYSHRGVNSTSLGTGKMRRGSVHVTVGWNLLTKCSDPITAVLSVEAARLQIRWREFQANSTEEERVDLKTSEPTIQGVISMVAEVGKIWDKKRAKGKRGKATRLFHRLCGTLDAHSNILELVPRGNEYVSLFSGTLTSILKASVNHETIVEELAMALCEISEHVADCETELELYRTEEMRRAVADLYAHIFLFLTDALDWYMKKRRKRLTDSFNERFMKEFEDEIENIKRFSKRIKRKVAHNSAAEQRVTRLIGEETHKETRIARIGLEGVQREQAELKYSAERFSEQAQREWAEQRHRDIYMTKLVEGLTNLLTTSAQSHLIEGKSYADQFAFTPKTLFAVRIKPFGVLSFQAFIALTSSRSNFNASKQPTRPGKSARTTN
jgi:hypothetical protein